MALEPIRAKVAEPLMALKSGLHAAKTLPEQAAALFAFLEQLDAMGTLEKRIEALNALGERERASEVSQVWNRMLGAMDQMVALMGDEPLPLEELSATLVGSLSASVIKALPQSGDAVFAQGMNSACSRPVKALMILGLSDRPGAGAAGLLTQGAIWDPTTAICRACGAFILKRPSAWLQSASCCPALWRRSTARRSAGVRCSTSCARFLPIRRSWMGARRRAQI